MNTFKRIISSKKMWQGIIGVVSAITIVLFQVDYTQELLTLVTAVTSLLVGGQTVLDYHNGSPSDHAHIEFDQE